MARITIYKVDGTVYRSIQNAIQWNIEGSVLWVSYKMPGSEALYQLQTTLPWVLEQ